MRPTPGIGTLRHLSTSTTVATTQPTSRVDTTIVNTKYTLLVGLVSVDAAVRSETHEQTDR